MSIYLCTTVWGGFTKLVELCCIIPHKHKFLCCNRVLQQWQHGGVERDRGVDRAGAERWPGNERVLFGWQKWGGGGA